MFTYPFGFLTDNVLASASTSALQKTVLYTGNGTSQTISGVGFAPDMVMIKERTTTEIVQILDNVSGTGTRSPGYPVSAAVATSGFSFTGDGFTVGTDSTINENAITHFAWCFKRGIPQGFDIVSYTGTGATQRISHNLNAIPKFIIVIGKNNGSTCSRVYHASLGAGSYWNFGSSPNPAADGLVWGGATPTTTYFTVGADTGTAGNNANGTTYTAFIWTNIAGASAFGTYTGNGSTTGPITTIGFQPTLFYTKSAVNTTAYWADKVRDSTNPISIYNTTLGSIESSASGDIDMNSTNFQPKNTLTGCNAANVYYYAAFA